MYSLFLNNIDILRKYNPSQKIFKKSLRVKLYLLIFEKIFKINFDLAIIKNIIYIQANSENQ